MKVFLKMILVFASGFVFILPSSMAFVHSSKDPVSSPSSDKNTFLYENGMDDNGDGPILFEFENQVLYGNEKTGADRQDWNLETENPNFPQEVQVAFLGSVLHLARMFGISTLSGATVGCAFGVFKAKANEDNNLSIEGALGIIRTLQDNGLIEGISPEDIDYVEGFVREYGLEKLHAASLYDSAIYSSFTGTYFSLFYSARSFLNSTGLFLSTLGGIVSVGVGAGGGLAGGAIGSLSCENAIKYFIQNDLVDPSQIDQEVKAHLKNAFDNLSAVVQRTKNFDTDDTEPQETDAEPQTEDDTTKSFLLPY